MACTAFTCYRLYVMLGVSRPHLLLNFKIPFILASSAYFSSAYFSLFRASNDVGGWRTLAGPIIFFLAVRVFRQHFFIRSSYSLLFALHALATSTRILHHRRRAQLPASACRFPITFLFPFSSIITFFRCSKRRIVFVFFIASCRAAAIIPCTVRTIHGRTRAGAHFVHIIKLEVKQRKIVLFWRKTKAGVAANRKYF